VYKRQTLLGLLLLIGVVVDDAIVVLENIFRHREHVDKDPISAAINGSSEVTFAVIAASLSLVCIFAPVIFMDGIVGMFFKSFGVVVTFGVLASLFVSLTLTPMLCSRYLSVGHKENKFYSAIERGLAKLDSTYHYLLNLSLNHRWRVLIITVLFVILGGGYAMKNVQKDFVPEADEGSFTISVKTPLGSSLEYTDSRLKLVEAAIAKHPKEVASYFSTIGAGSRGQVNQGNVNVRLVSKTERQKSQQELIKELKKQFDQIPGVKAIPSPASIAKGQRSEKLQFIITGSSLDEIGSLSKQMQQALTKNSDMGKVDLDVQLDLPQLDMSIDRTRAASLGLSANDVAGAVSMYAGGLNVAKYNDFNGDGQRYDIRLKADENEMKQTTDLSKIYLRSASGELVRLDAIASFTPTLGAAVIGRYDMP
jgi:HAE1 family hydrophobic/amphiphilic exporter-1